jgi:hypothetical protein
MKDDSIHDMLQLAPVECSERAINHILDILVKLNQRIDGIESGLSGTSRTVPDVLGTQVSTPRGFALIRFQDTNGTPCSLQQSSLATDEALWLGPDDAQPKVLASKAAGLGVKTAETEGWVPYPIPDDVLLTTRMHLTRDKVIALIGHLQTWVEKGEFE